jgi:16S rRNA (cytidine1402-2'-O)-methyltransferase
MAPARPTGRHTPASDPGPRQGLGPALYVVATPIGNLEDVTLRALRVLREADLIAAEDTRHTRTLLQHHGITRPLTSYYDAVERRRAPAIVERLKAGASVALVSDAGTPGISDPGYHLVRGAVEAGIPVVPIPGPSAAAALVSVAGLPADRFVFEGFLPTRTGPRAQRLRALAAEPRALVFFEAARRLGAFLEAAERALGDREAVVGRELTKRYEEFLRGRLSELRGRLPAGERLRGEVTVLVAGATEAAPAPAAASLDDEIRAARAAGRSVRELAADLARRTGLPRREIYNRAVALERD